MEIREARAGDRQAIRKLARRSLESSYSLGPRDIDSAVAEWYSDGRLDETLADEDSRLLVADDDGVVGFAEAVLTGSTTAQLLWLHVDPEHRGAGHGQRLFDATRERLRERGVDSLQGRVLAASQTGGAFYESQGLSKVGEEHTEIDGSRHVEYIYADLDEDGLEAVETDAGTRYVGHDTVETGSMAPFRVVYNDPDRESVHGYWCVRCESPVNAMDAMGRIRCDDCGNARKPTSWDSAYL